MKTQDKIKSRQLLSNDGELQTLTIELDANEIYPADPGQGTPAMVILHDASGKELDSGTYYCAVEQGELSYDGTRLSFTQMEWLESKRDAVDKFIEDNSPRS